MNGSRWLSAAAPGRLRQRSRDHQHRADEDRDQLAAEPLAVDPDDPSRAIDDATRLAYAEVLGDEKASTAIGFLRHALAARRVIGRRLSGRGLTEPGGQFNGRKAHNHSASGRVETRHTALSASSLPSHGGHHARQHSKKPRVCGAF